MGAKVRTVQYNYFFDDNASIRVKFDIDYNRVITFGVQLECLIDNMWRPVVRYDTAHGFAHRDLIHPSGNIVKTRMETQDYNEALTFAIQDLRANWSGYHRRYTQWLKQK